LKHSTKRIWNEDVSVRAGGGSSGTSALTCRPKDDDDEEKDEKADEKKDKPKEPPLVVSGGIKGGDDLVGKPALLDIEVGKGRVIAFGFDPIHRYQTESDFRLVWNAILNWNDLPPPPAR